MRTIILPDDKLKEVLDALQHSGSSIHHSHCSSKKTMHCDCHVAKAKAAHEIMRKAAERVVVRAGDVKVDQLLVTTTETVRVVSVQKGPGILPKVDIRIEHDDGTPETLCLGADEQVTVIDLFV